MIKCTGLSNKGQISPILQSYAKYEDGNIGKEDCRFLFWKESSEIEEVRSKNEIKLQNGFLEK